MCIIAIKPMGIEIPDESVLKNCWDNNDDGAGFMYAVHGKVKIEKGYMTFKSFKKALNKVKERYNTTELAMVFHFRIGTQGGNIPENTHPFPLTTNEAELQAYKINTTMGIVHNGMIDICSSFNSEKKDKHLSDTMIFIRDYLSELSKIPNWLKNESTLGMIKKLAGSKLTFLDTNGMITTIGDFIYDEETGCTFSNTTYMKREFKSYVYPLYNQKTKTKTKTETKYCFWNYNEIWVHSPNYDKYFLCEGWELETDGHDYFVQGIRLPLNFNDCLIDENGDEIETPKERVHIYGQVEEENTNYAWASDL